MPTSVPHTQNHVEYNTFAAFHAENTVKYDNAPEKKLGSNALALGSDVLRLGSDVLKPGSDKKCLWYHPMHPRWSWAPTLWSWAPKF